MQAVQASAPLPPPPLHSAAEDDSSAEPSESGARGEGGDEDGVETKPKPLPAAISPTFIISSLPTAASSEPALSRDECEDGAERVVGWV